MTEIPEHLLKRAQAAATRRRRDAGRGRYTGAAAGRRRQRRPSRRSRPPIRASRPICSSGPAPPRPRPRAATPVTPPSRQAAAPSPSPSARARPSSPHLRPPPGVPVGAGPGGHTQRLLTVVKSGSIQEVKATPVDKVHTWPHLLAAEFVASLACLAFTFVFSIFVNAPLLQLANTNQTPNPSKAPWYFLGLQELLTMFHPMVAGVTIPGVGLIVLIFAPYIDKNPSNKPEDRKFATSLMTIHLMFWAVLVIIGSFFRGPGFNFTLPWRDGLFFEL